MRPFVVVIFSIGLIAFIVGYLKFANAITPEPIEVRETAASGKYDLHLTLPFDAKPSFFSSIGDPESIVIRFRGEVIYRHLETVQAGTPIVIKDVPGIKVGENEFHVFVSPGDAESSNRFDNSQDVNSKQDDPFNTDDLAGGSSRKMGKKQLSSLDIQRAIKLTIFEQGDAEPKATKTLWSGDQAAVEGTIMLVVKGNIVEEEPNLEH